MIFSLCFFLYVLQEIKIIGPNFLNTKNTILKAMENLNFLDEENNKP